MTGYKLTKKADTDLENIWDYTFKKWGQSQAREYLENLEKKFQFITENPELGTDRSYIQNFSRSSNEGEHVIYYRQYHHHVRIIRVLHQTMNPKKQIN